MKSFLLIIVLLTKSGEFQMSTSFVDACPEKKVVVSALDKMIADDKIIGWTARCVPAREPADVKL
jgi:hypothetical protein